MKFLHFIIKIVSNRYLLVSILFLVWIVFFDDSNFFTQRQRKNELSELNEKIDFYKSEVTKTRNELNNLQSNPATLEKYAREKYFMKRDNEEVFVFDSTSTIPQIK